MSILFEQFTAAIAAAGIRPPDEIIPDGVIHRYSLNGGDDLAGWYSLHLDGIPNGVFGDWHDDIIHKWHINDRDFSAAEEAELRAQIEAARQRREEQKTQDQLNTRTTAAHIWQTTKDAPADHPCLVRKQVKPHGLHVDGLGRLVTPLRDIDGILHSLQFIPNTDKKLYLLDSRISGCFFTISPMPDNGGALYIAEGFATAATIHEVTGITTIAATCAGNLLAVAQALRIKYPSMRITICADDDYQREGNPGLTKADKAAQAIDALLAVPDFGSDRPAGATDFNDLAIHAGAEAVRKSIEKAKKPDVEEPLPLFPSAPDAETFPIDELVSALSPAAKAITSKVQVPEAMAAQSILAASTLAACAHADVLLPFGQTRPLTLFLATVAASGDRKSSSDNEALRGVRKYEKTLRFEYEALSEEWRIDHTAWIAQKRKIEGDGKIDSPERRARLAALGKEPEKPPAPFLLCADPTIEGLIKNWPNAHAALGLFTAEGSSFTCGHGMNDENRLRTSARFSELWDGLPITRVRATDTGGVTILPGRRLAMHLMIQPKAASAFFSNEDLRDQGLLSRILVARPASMAGTRLHKEIDMGVDAAIEAFNAQILELLMAPPTFVEGKQNELAPRVLHLSAEATVLWNAFSDHIEPQVGRGGPLEPIKDFATKAPEEAAKIAGVMAIFENLNTQEIDVGMIRRGITLADWYVNEALRVHQINSIDPALRRAAALLEWMQDEKHCPERRASISKIMTHGPNQTRTKNAAEEALAILISHRWVTKVLGRPVTYEARAK